MGHLFAWDAMLAAEGGDGDRVVADIEAMLGVAWQTGRPGSTLIEQLVAADITRKALEAAGTVLRREPAVLTDEHLQRLAHRLVAQDVAPIMSLALERLGFQDILQRLYTDDGQGDGHITPQGLAILRSIRGDDVPDLGDPDVNAYMLAPAAAGFFPSRKELAAKYELFMGSEDERFVRPYWERGAHSPAHEWLDSLTTIDRTRYRLIVIMVPALGHVHTVRQSSVGRRDGLLTALALEMYRRRHGGYPKSLDELSPLLLPTVPLDRFTGSPMLYRVDGDQAVIYCVGQDLDDDGGIISADVPKRFLEVPEDADDTTVERYRKHNEKLKEKFRNETPNGRRRRIDKALSPAGQAGKDAPDGDWVLWHSAEWPVERDRPVVTD